MMSHTSSHTADTDPNDPVLVLWASIFYVAVVYSLLAAVWSWWTRTRRLADAVPIVFIAWAIGWGFYVFYAHVMDLCDVEALDAMRVGVSLVMLYFWIAWVYGWIRSVTCDPGYLPKDSAAGQDDDPTFCTKCRCFKVLRAHHCSACGRCVKRMDHHCPWINNCVGVANHKVFFQFVVYCMMFCTLVWICVWVFYLNDKCFGFSVCIVQGVLWFVLHSFMAEDEEIPSVTGFIWKLSTTAGANVALLMFLSFAIMVGLILLSHHQAGLLLRNTGGVDDMKLHKNCGCKHGHGHSHGDRDDETESVPNFDLGWKRNLSILFGNNKISWVFPSQHPIPDDSPMLVPIKEE